MAEIDIYSDEYVEAANAELARKPCTFGCGAVGVGEVKVYYVAAKQTASLAGFTVKVAASRHLVYRCDACGRKARLERA